MQKHSNLCDLLTNVLENTSFYNARLLQVKFLDDLMNRKKIKGANSATDLYLYFLGNPTKTVYDLFLNTSSDKYNKEINLQVEKLFSLREDSFKELTNKAIVNNDSDQSSIVKQKYKKSIAIKLKLEPELKPKFEESIAERIILRKRKLNEIAKKEETINNNTLSI